MIQYYSCPHHIGAVILAVVCLSSFLSTSMLISAFEQDVRIGAIYPVSTRTLGMKNVAGAQWLAGGLMAISDLNILFESRNIHFKLAVRDSKRTFSNTIVGTLDLVSKVFEGNGTHVVVGAALNVLSEAMAYVLRDYHVLQIAYATNSSALIIQISQILLVFSSQVR